MYHHEGLFSPSELHMTYILIQRTDMRQRLIPYKLHTTLNKYE